jgi:hypothetical protein
MYTGKKDLVKKSLLIGIMIAGLFAVLQFQSVYSEENASNEIINGTHLESEKQNDVSNVGEEDSNSTSSSPSSASSLPNSN